MILTGDTRDQSTEGGATVSLPQNAGMIHTHTHSYVRTSVPVWDWPYVHSWAFYFRTLVTVIVGVKEHNIQFE